MECNEIAAAQATRCSERASWTGSPRFMDAIEAISQQRDDKDVRSRSISTP